MLKSKKCSKCGEVKVAAEFHKAKKESCGLQAGCKICRSKKAKEYYKKAGKEIQAKHRRENLDIIKERQKDHYRRNKKQVVKKAVEYTRKRRKEDSLYKLRHNMNSLIKSGLKGKGVIKNTKTEEILGCSFAEFKVHLESQFKTGMNWENRSEWHIDHRIPLASAKTEEEVIKLCHYSNLQPLWAHENLSKGAKLPVDMAP